MMTGCCRMPGSMVSPSPEEALSQNCNFELCPSISQTEVMGCAPAVPFKPGHATVCAAALLQVGAHQIDQVFRQFCRVHASLFRGEHVQPNVILQHLSHQTVDAAANV